MAVRRAARLAIFFLLCTSMAPAARAAETRISFTLDRAVDAASIPLLFALDRGDYKAAAINVTIAPAANSQEAIQRVASGGYDMGLADLSTFIRFHDENPKAPVKAVYVLTNRPAFSIIGRKSRGIASPKDLEGKKLGAPAADISFAQWPIFVKATGIDPMKVTVENIGAPVREPMLAAGQVDAITGLTFSSYVDLKQNGVPLDDIVVLPMADYGVDLYGNTVIVNMKFANAHPDAVAGFLRALTSGIKRTARDPGGAVDSLLKRIDAGSKQADLDRLKLLLRHNVLTPEVTAHGLGEIDPARFTRALDQIALTYKFQHGKPKPDDVFDGAFMPSAADRAVK